MGGFGDYFCGGNDFDRGLEIAVCCVLKAICSVWKGGSGECGGCGVGVSEECEEGRGMDKSLGGSQREVLVADRLWYGQVGGGDEGIRENRRDIDQSGNA